MPPPGASVIRNGRLHRLQPGAEPQNRDLSPTATHTSRARIVIGSATGRPMEAAGTRNVRAPARRQAACVAPVGSPAFDVRTYELACSGKRRLTGRRRPHARIGQLARVATAPALLPGILGLNTSR